MVIAGTFEGLEARDLIIGAAGIVEFVRAETVSVEENLLVFEAESLNIGEAGIVAGEITTDALAVVPNECPVH